MSKFNGIRGRIWFKALTSHDKPMPGDPPSVLVADAPITTDERELIPTDHGVENARFLCVVPDHDSRFPCASHGEVGLEQAYTLAARIREIINADSAGNAGNGIVMTHLQLRCRPGTR